jgi:phage terminase large subunit
MNTIITDQELEQAKRKFLMYAKFWLWNPVSFIYSLGIAKILPYQAEILHAIVDNKRTIVRSGHGAGKTFIMSLCACWWLCFHWLKGEGCSVIVTSPSSSNLTTVFWSQFSKCMDLLPDYLRNSFTITSESCYESEDTFGWRLDLRTARKENPDAMQGQHNVLFLVDEWSGVPIEIYKVIEGSMSDEGSRILAIGNPLRRSGWGYEAHTKNKDLWKLIHIDCEKYTSEKEFETDWVDILGLTHTDTNNGRVDAKEVQKWLDISGGDKDGYDYRIRVRGEFPLAGKNQYIDMKVITPCFKRELYTEQKKVHTLGLDPATDGGDDIALVHRWGNNLLAIKTWQEADTRQIAYQVRDWIKQEGGSFEFDFIAIDAIGDGKGVYDSLYEMKENGQLPNLKDVRQYKSSFEAPDKERFDRLRDYVYDKMKWWFINDKPAFHPDFASECDNMKEEIVAITAGFNSQGKLKIESKQDMRKRGIKSPNITDALTMTFLSSDDTDETKTVDRYQRAIERMRENGTSISWRAI